GVRDDGKPITSCVAVPVERTPAPAKSRTGLTANQHRFLDILAEAILDAPAEHKTTIGGAVAVSREGRKMCCIAKGWLDEADSDNKRRAKLSNVVNALAGKRQVGVNKLYVWAV